MRTASRVTASACLSWSLLLPPMRSDLDRAAPPATGPSDHARSVARAVSVMPARRRVGPAPDRAGIDRSGECAAIRSIASSVAPLASSRSVPPGPLPVYRYKEHLMMRADLNDALLRSIKPPLPGQRLTIWDTRQPRQEDPTCPWPLAQDGHRRSPQARHRRTAKDRIACCSGCTPIRPSCSLCSQARDTTAHQRLRA
jgi:hypothetical protein